MKLDCFKLSFKKIKMSEICNLVKDFSVHYPIQ